MRVYIAPGAGLGDREVSALKRLSPNSRMLILDELQHPDSHGTVKWILNHRDPEAALADAITENVQQASADAASGGLGGGLGKSFFKKLAKLHRKIFHSVVKVQKKVFKADPIHKAVFGGKKRRPGTAPVAAAAATAAAPAPSGDPGPSAPPPVYAPPPTPDASQYTQASQGPVNYVQEQPPDAAPAPAPDAAPAPAPASAPDVSSPYQTGTDETAGLPSASGYTLVVEGQTITNYPVPIGTLSSLIQSGTQPGDRFEIMADGVGTGLRVRTATGFISIPESMRAQVMAMPHDQVLALLTQAASNVAAKGTPTPDAVPTAPAAGGGGTLWMLGAGAAALLAMSGRKHR